MSEPLLDLFGAPLGDVLVERAWPRAGRDDALDGAIFVGAEGMRVTQRRGDVLGVVALAQEQDPLRVVGAESRPEAGESREEVRGAVAESLEGGEEPVEINRPAIGLAVDARRPDVPAWSSVVPHELVAHEELQVGAVDEELVLRHAHRDEVVDRLIRNGVPVAAPRDESIDGADPVDDPRGVVGMARQRQEMRRLFLERHHGWMTALAIDAHIRDLVLPGEELRAHIRKVAERSSVEKGSFKG